MIYLIGGPPKCGKTTLAKELSKSLGISCISTDTLQCVAITFINDEDYTKRFPTSGQRGKDNDEKYGKYTSEEIRSAYRTQAESVFPAIQSLIECELSDGNDFILEGYHIEPTFIKRMNESFPGKIKSIILVKTDTEGFLLNIRKSTTFNDWIISRTHNEETFRKIAKMICEYGKIIENEGRLYDISVFRMDTDFELKIQEAIKYLR